MIFNNSGLVDAEMCWRKYYLNHVRRLGRTYEESSPTFTARFDGILWHAIMAEHYTKGTHFGLGIEGLIEDAFKEGLEKAEFDEERDEIFAKKTWFFDMYEAYAENYKEEDSKWEILGVEEQLLVPMDDHCPKCQASLQDYVPHEAPKKELCKCGAPIDYLVAQIDLRYLEDNVRRICDHKTKKTSVSEAYLMAFQESSQFTHYMYCARRAFDEDYHTGTANVVAKLKYINKKGNPFHRNTEIIRGPLDFLEWKAERVHLRQEISRRSQKDPTDFRSWPRNSVSCRRWGLCDYYGFCWPTRGDWFNPPEDLADSFEEKEEMHIDNYKALLQGESSG